MVPGPTKSTDHKAISHCYGKMEVSPQVRVKIMSHSHQARPYGPGIAKGNPGSQPRAYGLNQVAPLPHGMWLEPGWRPALLLHSSSKK